jgi:hypothetical protein
MNPIVVAPVMPSPDEKTSQERLRLLMQAAADMRVEVDPQGYAMSWLSDNSRAFVARDAEGKTVAFAHLAFGRPYHHAEFSSTVMILSTQDTVVRQQMLEYLRNVSQMLGATVMLFEGVDGDTFPSEQMPLRAHRIG